MVLELKLQIDMANWFENAISQRAQQQILPITERKFAY